MLHHPAEIYGVGKVQFPVGQSGFDGLGSRLVYTAHDSGLYIRRERPSKWWAVWSWIVGLGARKPAIDEPSSPNCGSLEARFGRYTAGIEANDLLAEGVHDCGEDDGEGCD